MTIIRSKQSRALRVINNFVCLWTTPAAWWKSQKRRATSGVWGNVTKGKYPYCKGTKTPFQHSVTLAETSPNSKKNSARSAQSFRHSSPENRTKSKFSVERPLAFQGRFKVTRIFIFWHDSTSPIQSGIDISDIPWIVSALSKWAKMKKWYRAISVIALYVDIDIETNTNISSKLPSTGKSFLSAYRRVLSYIVD